MQEQSIEKMGMGILQNSWYNCLIKQLRLDQTMFQIMQSMAWICTDLDLWDCQNLIPPKSLTFNPKVSSSNKFLTEYATAVNLIPPAHFQSKFEEDVGAENYQDWLSYLAGLEPTTPNQLPQIFRDWAILYAPDVMQAGVNDLINAVNFKNAQNQLLPYQESDPKPADFTGGYEELVNNLDRSPGNHLNFDNSNCSSDVTKTWTGGINISIDGLWTGSGTTSRISGKFAGSKVTVNVSFKAYLIWPCTPGSWYNSSFLNLIFSDKSIWGDENKWLQFFGPQGCIQYFPGVIVVADGIIANITSNAFYNMNDQQAILNNSSKGLWPFYIPSEKGISANTVTFGKRLSGMTVETIVQPNHPIVIGRNVLGIARYLGRPSI